ncbi:MAG: hypothetical protein F4Y38_12715 [Gemmatimonadetes bacterium]|nr:hypothetical protein [Gemmatimonadota bacterium]MYG84015.1 hypothetical protein [Gemmatimonadota bacterium]MYJ88378.1 hypothetical protein [Gemmatimonadota bacterium]
MDANKFSDYLNPEDENMEPVRRWMKSKGKLVYSPTEKLKQELDRHKKMRLQIDEYRKNGSLKQYPAQEVERVKDRLPSLQSDDPDIIALAQVAEVGLLVSGDTDLHADFKAVIGGSVYQTRKHSRLLRRDTCP